MTEQLHEMLGFVLEEEAGITSARARSTAAYFSTLEEFLETPEELFHQGFRSLTGKLTLNLSNEDIENIVKLQASGHLSPDISIRENFLSAISRHFTRKQIDMIQSLSLDQLTPNPFLISALGLNTPREVITLNVYMRAGRSVVTSMGSFIEDLLVASSDTAHKVKRGWDIRKIDDSGPDHWIQIKSGPNDMDKDQIEFWAGKIADLEGEGEKGYIGITYGTRDMETVTLGLLESYLPDWEIKTLIGRELWDFVGDDEKFHEEVCVILREAAHQVLNQRTFVGEIDSKASALEEEFIDRFGQGGDGVKAFIDSIL